MFVSSTIKDFADLRSALRYWLEQMGLDVQMSEYNDFERRPDADTFESCFESIRECDYFILLIGRCPGTLYSEQEQVSVTRKEFRVALDCARRGTIGILPFVRKEVLYVLDGEIAPSSDVSCDWKPIQKSFINEIQSTSLASFAQEPTGSLWRYAFDRFEDIVDTLRVTMNLRRSLHRQVLLANLKWEIEENLKLILEKPRDGPLFPVADWLMNLRNRIHLVGQEHNKTFAITREDVKRIAAFLLILPPVDRISSDALASAIRSGEMHRYDHACRCLVETAETEVLRALLSTLEQMRLMLHLVQSRSSELFQVFNPRLRTGTQATSYDLVMLFRLHDLFNDLLLLSEEALNYVGHPDSAIGMPQLSPTSPYEDEVAEIERERISHQDIEQFIAMNHS